MSAQPLEIDLRGKSLNEVIQLLKKNGFSASSTNISVWDAHPGPATQVVFFVQLLERSGRCEH